MKRYFITAAALMLCCLTACGNKPLPNQTSTVPKDVSSSALDKADSIGNFTEIGKISVSGTELTLPCGFKDLPEALTADPASAEAAKELSGVSEIMSQQIPFGGTADNTFGVRFAKNKTCEQGTVSSVTLRAKDSVLTLQGQTFTVGGTKSSEIESQLGKNYTAGDDGRRTYEYLDGRIGFTCGDDGVVTVITVIFD